MSQGNNVPFLQLADLIQSVSSQNQSGLLIITSDNKSYRVVFSNGHICACTDPKGGALYQSLCWLRLLSAAQLHPFMSGDINDIDDEDLAQIVLGQGLVDDDSIRDAVDSIIEEVFTQILGWQKPDMQFLMEGETNTWEQYQIQLGTMIPASGLLMEGLRRQDELSRYAHFLRSGNDVLMADHMSEEIEQQVSEAGHLLWEKWENSISIEENLRQAQLPPWQGLMTLAQLQQINLIREPTAAELVVLASNLNEHDQRHKELLLRKAIKLGADNARIHLTLADLALGRKANERASKDLLAAAESLQTQEPKEATNALLRVLQLGIHKETALHQLIAIYRNGNQTESLSLTLLQLAFHNRDVGKIEESLQAGNEARDLGADVLKCEQLLAECSIKQFDKEQALMHLELAANAANERGLKEVAISILQQMIGISAGHVAAAKHYAEYLFENQQVEAAKTILLQALNDRRSKHGDDEIVQLRELLAQIDPSDSQNHGWLAHFYQEHKDRVAASAQLLKLADAQENEKKFQALTETLDRVLEMAGPQVPILLKQARLQAKLGYEARSIISWDACVTKLIQQEDFAQARSVADEALLLFPYCKELHIRRGKLANKEGDRNTAIQHYRSAVYLAQGAGDYALAKKLLSQLLVLQPEDVLIRCQLADIARLSPGEDDDEILHTLIRLAVKSNNIGIALDRARQRVQSAPAPAFDARSELIELLRRCNQNQEEKQEGLRLFHDLIEAGDYNTALSFLERLVASTNGQDSNLVFQLAELYEALERDRQSIRYYRHAVVLFQQEGRNPDALQALNQLLKLTKNAEDVTQAISLLNANQAINWESIRTDVHTKKHGSKSFNNTESSVVMRKQ